MQSDRIVNVRIELSLCLKAMFSEYKNNPKIQKMVDCLKYDPSRDISLSLKDLRIVP